MSEVIRVMLVDDSPLALAKLKQIIAKDSTLQVVGEANNGIEALKLIPEIEPQVICTDLYMPKMDGLELTKNVMQDFPLPILVISTGVQENHGQQIFDLLKAGAVDVLPKPKGGGSDLDSIEKQLIRKIKILSGVKVFRRRKLLPIKEENKDLPKAKLKSQVPKIAILGTSTGGPQTLEKILTKLTNDIQFPVICIQHIGEEFIENMIQWLGNVASIPITFAEHGQLPKAGIIYFPPKGKQLAFLSNGAFDCSNDKPYEDLLPAVDFTLLSANKIFGKNTLACILTGMGRDGTEGLKAVYESGGYTIAQEGETCIVNGMPKAAQDAGVVREVCTPEQLADRLINYDKK